ncbi:MAG: agmatinase [Colwellia sp.]
MTLFDDVALKENNIRLLTLGGEHSTSYAPIKKYLSEFANLVVLPLNAHADLCEGYLEYRYSHASIIRRITDHFGE